VSEIVVVDYQRQLTDVTRDIRIKTGQFLLDAIEIGRLLHEAKAMVPAGGWMQYVEKELPFSQSWANNYMRLYSEYGSDQLSIFGNSQATARLSPTQALELLALPAEDREQFIEDNDVENMSTRELKQAIRERDEAIRAKETAEEAQREAESAANDAVDQAVNAEKKAKEADAALEKLRGELTQAKASSESAAQKVEKLTRQLTKAKENEQAAKTALEKAKENPEIPEAVMEQMRQQVATDAAKAATEDLQKQLDAAVAAQSSAEAAKKEAEQKLEAAQKALKLANPEVAVLQEMTKRLLSEFNSVNAQLLQVLQTDPESGVKLKQAILGTIDQMRGMIAGDG